LLGKHYIQLIKPDGTEGEFYTFNIEDVKILPQPMGTIFDKVLNLKGEIENKVLANGRIAVLDIGKYTVDLALTDSLDYVGKSSISFNDIGIFEAYKDLSFELKNYGYDIPADSLEPFIRNGKKLNNLYDLKRQVFATQAEKIISRVCNTWSDMWTFDQIYITGGGVVILGEHIIKHLDTNKATICDNPTLTNCRGYYKFAKKKWI
jgi:plasmid segregation protein ParM